MPRLPAMRDDSEDISGDFLAPAWADSKVLAVNTKSLDLRSEESAVDVLNLPRPNDAVDT